MCQMCQKYRQVVLLTLLLTHSCQKWRYVSNVSKVALIILLRATFDTYDTSVKCVKSSAMCQMCQSVIGIANNTTTDLSANKMCQ